MTTPLTTERRAPLAAFALAVALMVPHFAEAKTIVLARVNSLFPISDELVQGTSSGSSSSSNSYSSGAMLFFGFGSSGSGTIRTGAGTLSLNSTNTFTGGFDLTGGTLGFVNPFTPIVLSSGTISLTNNVLSLSGSGTVNAVATGGLHFLTVNNGGTSTITSPVTSNPTLGFLGSASIWNLANTSVSSGTLTISANQLANNQTRTVSVTPAPEPTTSVLAALGLLTLASRRRRA